MNIKHGTMKKQQPAAKVSRTLFQNQNVPRIHLTIELLGRQHSAPSDFAPTPQI